jgi:hypothetical protein
VREQVADGDGGRRAVRGLRLEVRQDVSDGRVERELAEFDHAHGGCGDDRLGDRGKTEDIVRPHGAASFAVRLAVGPDVREFAVLHDRDNGPDDAFFVEGGLNGGVDALRDVCHGRQFRR